MIAILNPRWFNDILLQEVYFVFLFKNADSEKKWFNNTQSQHDVFVI